MFRFTLHGRLSAVNEPPWLPGPRMFRARAGNESLIRIRHDVPESVARTWLAATNEEQLRTVVEKHCPVETEYRGPAYVLPTMPRGSEAVPVDSTVTLHPSLVARGWQAARPSPTLASIRDGLVVAVCYSSRLSDEAAAAGVETAEGYRGQGLARRSSEGMGGGRSGLRPNRLLQHPVDQRRLPARR